MTNITTYPLIDDFETTLAQERDGATGTVYLDSVPSFTFPASVQTYMVSNPWKTNMQAFKISAIDTSAKTVTVSSISVNKWASVAYSQQTHAQGSVVRICDSYQFWKDIVDSVNSKLDANWGNTTTTFDLDLSWSLFRIRKDGNDMKFTDDNQAEVTLSQLASWAWVNDKVKMSATDTTEGYLNSKLTAWDGLSKTLVWWWGNETLDLDIDLSDTTIFATTATASRAVVTWAWGTIDATFVPPLLRTITAGEGLTAGNIVYVESDSKAYKSILWASSAAQLSTITGLDTGNKPVQTIYLSKDLAIVLYQKSADNIVYANAVSFAQRTPSVGAAVAVSSATATDGTFAAVALSATTFVVWYNKSTGDNIYCTACTVSWTEITAWSEVDLSDGLTCSGSTWITICKLSSSKFVVWFLQDTALDPRINAGSVSWTTITASAWSAALEAVTAAWVPLMTYVQDDVIATFYDNGTDIRHKMVTYSGTVPSLKTATTTIAGVLSNGEARVVSVGNGTQILFKFATWWIIKAVPITVVDQSAWTQGTYDSAQVYDIYLSSATSNYFDISYLWNNVFALVSTIDGISDIRVQLLEKTFNGFKIRDDRTITTTCTYPAVCALSDVMNKVFMARKNWSDLYYSVYLDTSEQVLWAVKADATQNNSASIVTQWDATISWLTAWLAYYVWDAWAVATTGTRRLWIATSTTNLYLQ